MPGIKKYLLLFLILNTVMGDSLGQTVLFQSGFEASDPAFSSSMSVGSAQQPVASNPRTGSNSGRMYHASNNTAFDGSIITGSTINFVTGKYYTVEVWAKVSCAASILKIAKSATATNAAMKAATGSDRILWPGSANVTSSTYSSFSATFLASATESKYVGFQVVSGNAGGCQSNIYLDDVVITEYDYPPCGAYCSSAGTTSTVGHISNVQFNTINRTSTFDGYLCTGTSTTVNRECTYDLIVQKTNSGAYTTYTAAWIDWNQDGVFNNTDEYVLTSESTAASSGVTSRTQSISVPATAVLGTTKMRVFFKYNTTIATNGCDNGTIYEDVEDYDIVIASANSPICASGFSPASGSGISSCMSSVVTLSWTSPGCVSNYKIYFDQNPSPSTLVSTQAGTSYSTGSISAGTYYWKIVPTNSTGDASGCSVQSFTISSAIAAPVGTNITTCNNPWSFNLSASGGSYSDYFWFDASSGGNSLGTGSLYTTPEISATTSYYVSSGALGSETSLATTLVGAACGSGGNAVMYNLENISTKTMVISGLPVAINTSGNRTVSIYWRNGTYSGNETSNVGWNLDTSSGTFSFPTSGAIYYFSTYIPVAPGATVGIYVHITTDAGIASNPAATYQDANLKVINGARHCTSASPFSGTLINDRGLLGSVKYKLVDCESSRTTVQGIIDAAYTGAANYGIYAPDGSPTVTDCEIVNGATICGATACKVYAAGCTGYTNSLISYMAVIQSGDATNNYSNCSSTNINLVTSAGSPDWTGSSAPLTGTGSPKTVSYTTTGRKDVTLLPASSSSIILFSENFEGSASGWTGKATGTPSSSQNYWVMGTSGTTAKSGWYSGGTSGCGTNNTVLSGSYSPRVAYYHSTNPGKGLYCDYSSVTVTTTNLRLKSPAFSTVGYSTITLEFNYVGKMNASDHVQLQYSTDGSAWTNIAGELYNGTVTTTTLRTVTLPAGCNNQATLYLGWNFNASIATSAPPTFILDDIVVKKTVSVSNTYAGFNNILMAPPSAGTILGLLPTCPGSYSFASSYAGTPGYTFTWSASPSTGVTFSDNATSTAGNTTVTFPNTTTSYTLSLSITSECCGVLSPAPPGKAINIEGIPEAPTTSGPVSICTGASTILSSTAPAGSNFSWYDASTDGNLLYTGANYTVSPASTTTYYAQAVNASGCASATRTALTVTVSPTSAPTVADNSICGSGNVTLSVSSPEAGYTYNWYTGSCGGALVQSGTSTSLTQNISSSTTYYVGAVAPGCNMSSCDVVTATVISPPALIDWLVGAPAGPNNWFNSSSWESGCVPTCATDVNLDVGAANQPDIGFNASADAAVNNLTLGSTRTLSFSDSKANLNICGSFNHNGILTSNNLGSVTFSGSLAQTYTITGGTGSFNNLTINNSSATGITLSQNTTIGSSGVLTLVDGELILNDKILIVSNPSTDAITGGTASSYIKSESEDSKVQWNIGATTGAHVFPFGKSGSYLPITFNNSGNSGNVTAATWSTNSANTPKPSGVTYMTGAGDSISTAVDRFWNITSSAGSTIPAVNLTLSYLGAENATTTSPATTRGVQHWAGSYWNDGKGGAEGTVSTSADAGVTSGTGTVAVSGITQFSPFVVVRSASPLPVELLSFNVYPMEKAISITWETASEINNDHFSVERSVDGMTFNTLIERIPSLAKNGNSSNNLNYFSKDENPIPGKAFYRLKQVDFDGSYKYSQIVAVDLTEKSAKLYLFPNPASDKLNLLIDQKSGAIVRIYDVTGQIVLEKTINKNEISGYLIDISTLATGIYSLLFIGEAGTQHARFIKEK